MRSSFFEFNVAKTGLFLAQNALNVTANNIANAATPGHSRQVPLLRANTPLSFNNGRGMTGTGASMHGIGQMRSVFLDQRLWSHNSTLGEFEVKRQHLTLTESIFNATSEMGLSGHLDSLFSTLQDLSVAASDMTSKSSVLNTAQTFATQINAKHNALRQQQDDLNQELRVTVNLINSIGEQIRNLNEQISRFEMDGTNANSLRDQRALLVDQLSQYVNTEVREVEVVTGPNTTERRFVVQINGWDLVNDTRMNSLDVQRRTHPRNPEDINGLYDIVWATSAQEFDMYHPRLSGSLRALIDLRDGNNNSFMQGTAGSIVDNDNGTHTVTVNNFSRHDLNSSGRLSFADPLTQRTVEFDFNDLNKIFDDYGNVIALQFIVSDMTPEQAERLQNSPVTSGQTSVFKGIPYYKARLDDMVRTLARAFNEGLDRNGDPLTDVTGSINAYTSSGVNNGHLFFTAVDRYGNEQTQGRVRDYSIFNARNFQVSSFLQNNPAYLPTSVDGEAGESSNTAILGFLEIKNNNSLFREGAVSDFVIAIAVELAIDLRQADRFYTHYSEILTSIENQRQSIMGVSLDEEAINMVRFQQLLNASARMINVIDGIYDTLINGLGAGR